jgi:hypothetical protein
MPRKSKKSLGTDQCAIGSKEPASSMSVPSDTIVLIMRAYRDRRFAMEQRKRSNLALGAYLRSAMGWRKDLPEAERKVIATKAAAVLKDATDTPWETMVNASIAARGPFEAVESAALREMECIAKALPVWAEFGEGVRGFGLATFRIIRTKASFGSVWGSR